MASKTKPTRTKRTRFSVRDLKPIKDAKGGSTGNKPSGAKWGGPEFDALKN